MRSPKFMGDPFVPAPCSSTPARPTYQVTTVGRRGPTHILPRRLSTSRNFGAPSHGIGTRCLRFAVRLTPPHARLASGCPARLYQAGLITRRVPKKGFRHVLHRFPLSHASWRKECPVFPSQMKRKWNGNGAIRMSPSPSGSGTRIVHIDHY